jgi:hypothetical protein
MPKPRKPPATTHQSSALQLGTSAADSDSHGETLSQQHCVGDWLTIHTENRCMEDHGLATTEMGEAFLPSPADRGCGLLYDKAWLNEVNMRGEDGQIIGRDGCASRAAQMLCGVNFLDDQKGGRPWKMPDPSKMPRGRQKTLCFCSSMDSCTSMAAVHFSQRPQHGPLSMQRTFK